MHDYLLKIEIGVENKSQLLLLNKITQCFFCDIQTLKALFVMEMGALSSVLDITYMCMDFIY